MRYLSSQTRIKVTKSAGDADNDERCHCSFMCAVCHQLSLFLATKSAAEVAKLHTTITAAAEQVNKGLSMMS